MRRSMSERSFDAINISFMLAIIVATLYPFYYVLAASFSDSNRLLSVQGLLLLPVGFNFEAYLRVFDNPNIWSGYGNTLIILIVGTVLNIVITTIGAYGLSKKTAIRKTVMLGVIFTMYFGGGLIPNYLLVNNWLHMGDSYWALIVPGAISTWNLIIMVTSLQAVPESLIESGRIDGAGEWGILWRIVVPLSMPVIAVMILYYGVAHWNSWFSAMLYIRNRELFPLQLILREILVQNATEDMQLGSAAGDQQAIGESIKYATVIVATLPILFIYPFLQRYFVKGVMVGAVKE